MDREGASLESVEWLVGLSESLNRDLTEATGDPLIAHAGVVLIMTFLAAAGPVDPIRLTGYLDSFDVDAAGLMAELVERGLVATREPDGAASVALTPAGYELVDRLADAVGASLGRSEDLERMRDRHLPR